MKQTTIHTDPQFRERLAAETERTLNVCWNLHGELPVYPKATREVLLLLASLGWDCLPNNLDEYIESGEFNPPAKIFNLYAWQAEDVARLMRFLDEKRKWLVGFHVDMKTEIEIAHDEAEAAKGMQMLEYYQRLPREELEHRLSEARTSPTRELLTAAMRLQEES